MAAAAAMRPCSVLASDLADVIRASGPLAEARARWYLIQVLRHGEVLKPLPGDDPLWWAETYDVRLPKRYTALSRVFGNAP